MPLQPDHAIAHYRIVEKIGEGGMGEVYRADDTKLGRSVAIKVLPEAFVQDQARLARFAREAQLLASLNHPNIAAIYGLEETQGATALALELVEGETLAERIQRGPLPVEDTLAVGLQIAEALEAAHDKGIIHRDLKPGNIKFAADGRVKVLDFGLAKALDEEVGPGDLTRSPTLTMQATQAGVILGTASYMSPEQARGMPVDRRTDIWSLGCVLFEMLTARRPFSGDTVPDTMARILERAPDLGQLPAGVPRRLRHLLHRCLTKEVRNRVHDVADVRIEMREILDNPEAEEAPQPAAAAPAPRWAHPAWLAAGLLIGALSTAWWLSGGAEPAPASTSSIARQTSINLPASTPLSLAAGSSYGVAGIDIALSPDGTQLAYVAMEDGVSALYLRQLDRFGAVRLAGTEAAQDPSFSPDGTWIAFFTEQHLKKVSVNGGQPVTLCDVRVAEGQPSWTVEGTIYFVSQEGRLVQVPDTGGDPKPVGPVLWNRGVHALPDGRGLLFSSGVMSISNSANQGLIVHLSLETGAITPVLENAFMPRYVEPDLLLFARDSDLYATRFDISTLQVSGPPVRVVEGLWTDSLWGRAQYTSSRTGAVAYVPGEDWSISVPSWLHRDGQETALPVPPRSYGTFELSPDGTRMAIVVTGAQDQVHLYDRNRRSFERLTLSNQNGMPVWAPDGRSIVFSSKTQPGVDYDLFRVAVDGGTAPTPLFPDADETHSRGDTNAVSPDGTMVIYGRWSESADLLMRPVDGSGKEEALLVSPYSTWGLQFSPDGRWVALISDRSGPYEVFVRAFPFDGREWQVSTGGGEEPRWSATGDTLYYRRNRKIMMVPIQIGDGPDGRPTLTAGTVQVALEATFHNAPGLSFDISDDGQRFLVNKPLADDGAVTEIRLMDGWLNGLDELMR